MKNRQIEGLRAIGVVMIVLFHYIYRFNELYVNTDNLILFSQWGTIGVGLFFILSGYLMFINKNIKNESLFHYYRRKIRRLYIPYLPAIILIFLVTTLIGLPGRTSTVTDLFLNIILLNGFIGTNYVDAAHWYLTYLILFTLLAGLAKKSNLRISYVVLAWIVFAQLVRFPIGRVIMPSKLSYLLQVISGGGNLYLFLLGVILSAFKQHKEELRRSDYIIMYVIFNF